MDGLVGRYVDRQPPQKCFVIGTRSCVLLKVEISFEFHENAEFVKNIGEDVENSSPMVQLVK